MQELAFLKIRMAQAFRELKALGLFYSVLLLGGICFGFYFFWAIQKVPENRFISIGVIAFLVLLINQNRSDHHFLRVYANRKQYVLFTEYLAFGSPFLILSLLSSGSFEFFLIIPLLFGISFISVSDFKILENSGIVKVIPEYEYEWRAGVRKNKIVLVFLYMVSLLSFQIPFLPMITLWLILGTLSSFYEQNESREMIQAYEKNASDLLWLKLIRHNVYLMILFILPLSLNLLYFPERWWVCLFFMIFSCINLSLFIVSKYAIWEPGTSTKSNSLINAICMISLILPFLIPLPVFQLIRNYRIAKHKLTPFLND